MRFVIYGAGGIGGTIGGRLALSGHDVVLICRRASCRARSRDLRRTHDGEQRVPITAAEIRGRWIGAATTSQSSR